MRRRLDFKFRRKEFEWTEEKYTQFRVAVESEADKLFFDVLYHLGLRVGEVIALTNPQRREPIVLTVG